MDVGEIKPSLSLGLVQMIQQHQMEQVNNVQTPLSGGNHTSDLSLVWTLFGVTILIVHLQRSLQALVKTAGTSCNVMFSVTDCFTLELSRDQPCTEIS